MVRIIELTVKQLKNSELAADCRVAGCPVSIHPVEGCRGFVGTSALQQRSGRESQLLVVAMEEGQFLRYMTPIIVAAGGGREIYWVGGETSVNGGFYLITLELTRICTGGGVTDKIPSRDKITVQDAEAFLIWPQVFDLGFICKSHTYVPHNCLVSSHRVTDA